MSYVIKLGHRISGETKYVGATPVEGDDTEFENTVFDSFEEASGFPYSSADVAALAALGFPDTENIDYEVVSAGL